MSNKLAKPFVYNWLLDHDLCVLTEIHSKTIKNVPGFKMIVSKSVKEGRGGVALLIKRKIENDIINIDLTSNDQIWFRIRNLPGIYFGGVYLPPTDSSYFDASAIASIQSRCFANPDMLFVCLGDINARFGMSIRNLVSDDTSLTYRPIDLQLNARGQEMLQLCEDCKLLPVNNLEIETDSGKQHFKTGLTFRKRQNWISELDYCLVSRNLIPYIEYVAINQSFHFPSDHAPLSVTFNFPAKLPSISQIQTRAAKLGDAFREPSAHAKRHPRQKKPLKKDLINSDKFKEAMNQKQPPQVVVSTENAVQVMCDAMYAAAADSRNEPQHILEAEPTEPEANEVVATSEDKRWQRILRSKDPKALWNAINWKGEITEGAAASDDRPSDNDFKEHMEQLLNPPGTPLLTDDIIDQHMHVPVLDNLITIDEVQKVIKDQVNAGKAPGPDGLNPALFKWLPAQWLLFLATLYNCVLFSEYPCQWMYAKLTMLFKSGQKLSCDNYRGISVTDVISKIYDYILCNRLMKWFVPDREQAGALPGRSCIEHIVALRLLFEFFRKKRTTTLFVLFVDFSKAYDRVPRTALIRTLIQLGCSTVMLMAIVSMYKMNYSILGLALITAVIGVRQGSPTSCFLFTVFVNTLIRNLKQCAPERYLGWLHCLMLMDDTVLLATTRESMREKLIVLQNFCNESGMIINEKKTKFFVINGDDESNAPFVLDLVTPNVTVKWCKEYVYLGCRFTADGKLSSSLMSHAKDKVQHLNKLITFMTVNKDIPFQAKRKVLEAAFNSAILYGCESWLKCSLAPVKTLYLTAIKVVLGVRQSTPNDIALVEIGLPSLDTLVLTKQEKFFRNILEKREHMLDDPFMHVFRLVADSSLGHHITRVALGRHVEPNDPADNIRTAVGSKFAIYRVINPSLECPSIYTTACHRVPEYMRISFTRMRTSSHRLRVETGRWARLNRDERLCICGQDVQDEEHVLQYCNVVDHLRPAGITFPECLQNDVPYKAIHEIIEVFET